MASLGVAQILPTVIYQGYLASFEGSCLIGKSTKQIGKLRVAQI
jgi:hypothetical protein